MEPKRRCQKCGASSGATRPCGNCRANEYASRKYGAVLGQCSMCYATVAWRASNGQCRRCLRRQGLKECNVCKHVLCEDLSFERKKGACKNCRTPLAYLTPKQRRYRTTLKKLYGMSFEDYMRIEEAQGGVCAICKEKPSLRRLCVDHNHETGAVRGLLCLRCNTGIGFMSESEATLAAAIDYLKRQGAAERVNVDQGVQSSADEQQAWQNSERDRVILGLREQLRTVEAELRNLATQNEHLQMELERSKKPIPVGLEPNMARALIETLLREVAGHRESSHRQAGMEWCRELLRAIDENVARASEESESGMTSELEPRR